MGSSHHLQISKIVNIFLLTKPHNLLDIGTGFGKYGFLAREYLDPLHENGTVIDAIEGYGDYISPVHRHVYDSIKIGDAHELINQTDKTYDLVILVDVLEHFTPEDGQRLLNKVLSNHRAMIISTPKYVGVQTDEHNDLQAHQSQWSKADFQKLGNCFFIADPISHIVYISKDAELVDKLRTDYRKTALRYNLGRIGIINWLYRQLIWNKKNSIYSQPQDN